MMMICLSDGRIRCSLYFMVVLFRESLFEDGYEAVDVTGAHSDYDIGAEGFDEVWDLVGAAEVFVHRFHLAQNHT